MPVPGPEALQKGQPSAEPSLHVLCGIPPPSGGHLHLKYFQVVDADVDEPVATVQAVSPKHAIGRFTLIKPLLARKKKPGSFWTVQETDTISETVPYYSDGYFQILESALAPE